MGQTIAPRSARPEAELVSVEHLRVRYGPTLAVDDVSLSIKQGEIFGVVAVEVV